MEYNNASPLMDASYWDQALSNNNYLGEGMRLELNQENVDILNNGQYPSSNEDMLDEDISRTYNYANNESISTSSSPSGIVNSHLNSKVNGIFSPVSVSEDKKKPKSKKQLLNEQDAMLIAKDDSELNEEELQMKRKAQNRAAQRAFRERKETKLKELECKLAESEEEKRRLLSQLNLVKQQNFSILTENEYLKNKSSSEQNLVNKSNDTTNVIFPKNQRDFIYGLAGSHDVNNDTINKVYENPEVPGKKLLAVGAVWDYLQLKSQESEKYENLDILEIMNCLKGNERCHGYGPAYPLELVEQIVDECSVLR
ncbi:unnamed protein product [Debaryomyces tyrocola]|nr:unnamed protein product [Debaryomyces tyrocola]